MCQDPQRQGESLHRRWIEPGSTFFGQDHPGGLGQPLLPWFLSSQSNRPRPQLKRNFTKYTAIIKVVDCLYFSWPWGPRRGGGQTNGQLLGEVAPEQAVLSGLHNQSHGLTQQFGVSLFLLNLLSIDTLYAYLFYQIICRITLYG